ncbi:hypothetical protein ZIOFF_053097 [Zingiber officinale]|uniref:F-box domain-containing protein n=1 Tax=Zingiber officinale TaxID=94328 RepID=A0A8J5KCQ3_ZINOF|nr:hypothetical protein ZIOFF_053097 [Zingiber officinale]
MSPSDSSGGNHHRSDPIMRRSSCAGTVVPRQFQRTMTMESALIPGLPDCLALECLLRLHFHVILNARAVCKRWKQELDSPSFYCVRRATGLDHRIVSLLLRAKLPHPHTFDKLHVALYEPATGVCTMRQLALHRPNINMRNSDATIVGKELVVIGGWDGWKNCRNGEVHIYDLFSGAWRPGAPNPSPERLFCKYFLMGGKVFVVGGRVAEGKKLRSALVYDVASDTWLETPDLGEDTCQGSSFDNMFWGSRENYDSAIQCCRNWLSLDDDYDLTLYPTKEEKEIFMSVPKGKKSDEEKSVTLNENALVTLRRRLGILPNELVLYLDSYYSGRL